MNNIFKVYIEKNFDNNSFLEIQQKISKSGGILEGDLHEGKFEGVTPLGKIKGKYKVLSVKELEINIFDKPFLVPIDMIKTKFIEYFS